MTDTDRVKWLNWYVHGDDKIELWEEDGGVVMWFGTRTDSPTQAVAGSSVEDCIDQVAQLHPMP